MKRDSIREAVVFLLLVTAGTALRLQLQHLPNFAPVAALALFAGYFFRSRLLAACVPLSVMLISDAKIGGYEPVLMVSVYGMLTAPVLLQPLLRARLRIVPGRWRGLWLPVAGLVGCSIGSALLFFVVTNFTTWLTSGFYERTVVDLFRCYWQAIPFFRFTLAGDLAFAITLFASYAACIAWSHTRATRGERLAAAADLTADLT